MKKTYAEQEPKEFNQMALYLERIDRRQEDRDTALNEGDVDKLYRTTLTLLINCIPKFEEKKLDFKELEKDIQKVGEDLVLGAKNSAWLKGNHYSIVKDLYKANISLVGLMFKAGMVYPDIKKKTPAEEVGEDF